MTEPTNRLLQMNADDLNAIETLVEQLSSRRDTLADVTLTESVVRAIGYQHWYDNVFARVGAPTRADSPDKAAEYLKYETLNEKQMVARLALTFRDVGKKIPRAVIKDALDCLMRESRNRRYAEIMLQFLGTPTAETIGKASAEWTRVASLFETSAELTISCLQHFIWQVKQKSLGRPVSHHLMSIVFSTTQGSGKTTFVRKLVGSLKELASADVLISDFADHRSGDIYSYPVVVVDDMEQLALDQVPVLKSVITSEKISRRKLHTSTATTIRQKATLIGTANRPVTELIADDTGHRRFFMMPFRNGNVAKGGDPEIWKTVSSIDYELLWQSVDAYERSPIVNVLTELHAHQNNDRPVPQLLKWLRDLDMQSDKILAITVRGGVRADMLRDLYVTETGDVISNQKFSDAMLLHMVDETTPFFKKHKKEIGAVYQVRDGHTRSAHDDQSSVATDQISPASVEASDLTITSDVSGSSGSSGSSGPSSSSGSSDWADGLLRAEVRISREEESLNSVTSIVEPREAKSHEAVR